jgi:hypothetical protein
MYDAIIEFSIQFTGVVVNNNRAEFIHRLEEGKKKSSGTKKKKIP